MSAFADDSIEQKLLEEINYIYQESLKQGRTSNEFLIALFKSLTYFTENYLEEGIIA